MTLLSTGTPKSGEQAITKHWLKQLTEAEKTESHWRKLARGLVETYESEKTSASQPYNILYSNTETLQPALYNQPPRPTVKPKFVQKDNALTRLAALLAQRLLTSSMDSGDVGEPNFDECMRSVIPESLVPGRGVLRVKYEATFKETPKEAPAEGEPVAEETVDSEYCCFEHWAWDDFFHGFGKSWQKLPWIAFRHWMTKEDLETNFDLSKKIQEELPATSVEEGMGGQNAAVSLTQMFNSAKTGREREAQVTPVFEIWDKVARKVIFISPFYKDKVLKEVDDPLKLQGFFPTPSPLTLYKRISSLVPQPLYKAYEQQAEELTDVTIRITKITRALRLRGFYNSAIEDMANLFTKPDNTLIPIQNAAQLTGQGLKLDDMIWIFPVEKLVGVLQQLYTQRQQVKTVIFEITGIADIMRGSSQASETLGAQEIKNQWGTLRLKRMQKEVARFCRDCLRLMLETMVGQISPEILRAMSGLPLPMRAEKEQMTLQFQQSMQQYQMMAVQAQAAGQQPPQAPQQPPELAAPAFEDVLDLLKSDLLRNFSIDIETNSTVDAEATEDKQDMAELMNAMAQFMNGIAPMVEGGMMPFDAAKTILVNLLRRFRMGGEMEEAIMAMSPPSQGGAGEAEQLKKMQEALAKEKEAVEKGKQDLQAAQQEFTLKQKAAEHDLQMQSQFAARENEQMKSFAMKEIEQERGFALKEVQQAQQIAEASFAAKVKAQEEAAKPTEPAGA